MAKKKAPKVFPLRDQLVVERVESEEKSAGGIFLPDAAKETRREGVVVAVGRGRLTSKGRLIEPTLKVGDRIVFGQYSGAPIEVDGESYIVMSEQEVLAVLD